MKKKLKHGILFEEFSDDLDKKVRLNEDRGESDNLPKDAQRIWDEIVKLEPRLKNPKWSKKDRNFWWEYPPIEAERWDVLIEWVHGEGFLFQISVHDAYPDDTHYGPTKDPEKFLSLIAKGINVHNEKVKDENEEYAEDDPDNEEDYMNTIEAESLTWQKPDKLSESIQYVSLPEHGKKIWDEVSKHLEFEYGWEKIGDNYNPKNSNNTFTCFVLQGHNFENNGSTDVYYSDDDESGEFKFSMADDFETALWLDETLDPKVIVSHLKKLLKIYKSDKSVVFNYKVKLGRSRSPRRR